MSSVVQDIICAIEFAADRGLRKFAHSDGKTRIALWRDAPGAPPATRTENPTLPQTGGPGSAATVGAVMVRTPLSGLCHLSPDPASPAFVIEGGSVNAGQTICLVEAMKVMTAVSATHSGTVTKVHVTNGSTVFSGDDLIEVQP